MSSAGDMADRVSMPADAVETDCGLRITSAGGPVYAAAQGAPGDPVVRLHLQIVSRIPGAGVAVVGWMSDGLLRVDRLTLEGSGDVAADLLELAVRDSLDLFEAPADATLGFATLLPDVEAGGSIGVSLRFADGAVHRCALPFAGDAAPIGALLAAMSLGFGLTFMARALSASNLRTRVPHLQHWAEVVSGHIDPHRNYGSGHGGLPVEFYVDSVTRVGSLGILIKGWLLKTESDRICDLAVVSLSGRRVTVPSSLPAVARPDVIKARAADFPCQNRNCGFVMFAPVPGLAEDDRFWFVELTMRSGSIRRIPFTCGTEPAPLQGIETTIALAEPNTLDMSDMFERALSAPLEWFWSKAHNTPPSPATLVYGRPTPDPLVSIIVPLYGRIDFVRHQIASFSNDPDFRAASGNVELIYVLDDPELEEDFKRQCRQVFEIYGVPFLAVLANANIGYSAANNVGAGIASGKLLLLLNSDVVPPRSRWVTQLAKLYAALDGCGVLGCRLLFEDGSIQHAGMNFRTSPLVRGAWANDHHHKGLPAYFDPCDAPSPVAAVTGACLMIDRALFLELGGLSQDYIIGDFEDSDLCLKVHSHGLNIYYTPTVELFHLERQSMQFIAQGHEGWRQSLTLFNMWKHSRRWASLIREVAGRYGDCENADPCPGRLTERQFAAPKLAPTAEPVGRHAHGEILAGFLAAISPEPFRSRLQQVCEEDPAVRVLSWMLGPEAILEWAHTIGVLDDPGLAATLAPLPPEDLRAITAASEEQVFLWTGLFDAQYFLGIYEQHVAAPSHGPLRVLDFGCGCGRLTRFLQQHDGVAAFGSDINPDLVDWCRVWLGGARVEQNDATPPLRFDDEAFDLIFSLSVFTHLAQGQAKAWLSELARVLVPGGLLVVTTHGYPALKTIEGSPVHHEMFRIGAEETRVIAERLPGEGHIFLPYETDILTAAKAGEQYGNAFIDPAHIQAEWNHSGLQFVDHVPAGLRGWQDVVVLRRLGR
jgi:GT2 family glycosyltransferase/SAM-dependent methyltransferase